MPRKNPQPKATKEIAEEYKKLSEIVLSDEETRERDDFFELDCRCVHLILHYDWLNYEFTDPCTGKKGMKDITGAIIIPPRFDGFLEFRSYLYSPHDPVKMFANGKYGIVAADGSGKVLLQFKEKSLRDTILDALTFIGVKDYSDFDLKKEFFNNPTRGIHDARHLYRVMIATALIAKKLNKPRQGLLAFCGAFLHDQARNHNGEDPEHGLRAVQTKWDMHSAIWKKYELTPDEQEYIKSAVSLHCSNKYCGIKLDKLVQQILHDADSFDRCRFRHASERLDYSYLTLPEIKCKDDHPNRMLKLLIGETEAVWCFTKDVNTFIPFKDFLENIR